MRSKPARFLARLHLAAFLPLLGCGMQESGEGPIVLHLTLHDSLQRYDSVQVAVADAAHPETDLEMVRSGPLRTRQIAAYTLTRAKDPFLVKVRGYRANHQLALETHIYYEAGRKRVERKEVPPQVPCNWLTRLAPSAGSLSPPFSLDQLEYTLDLPPNTSILQFKTESAYDKAVTTVAGDTVKVGAAAKVFPILGDSFSVPITVTDLGAPRTYKVAVKPVNPKARLDSVWFSAGALQQPFDPENPFIVIVLPADVNTVQVKFWTADDASTSILIDGQRLFAGVPKTVTLSSATDGQFVAMVVQKSAENKFQYTLAVTH
jgi:hypothetical protein